MISTTHPNGTKFTYVMKGMLFKYRGQWMRLDVKDVKPGVLIEYPDGVRRFISNSWYE